ncbi:MAG: B12-binding domain-containing radical SAM protein, partial [Verrucomicrobiota bacterium]|nr:B12-binding domain-containing radical SAM protein [Verrucomicrobiota bacterium]
MGLDVLFIAPGNSRGIYQELAQDYAAVEPPTWALLLAQSCRSIGFEAAICDANAERLDAESVFHRVQESQPRLICFVVYGQNVNAGTVNMSGATYLSNYLK